MFPIPCLRRATMVFFAFMGVPLAWAISNLIITLTVGPPPIWLSMSISVGMVLFCVGVIAYIILRVRPLTERAKARGGMVCIECAYDLPDEDTGRCPECGRDFNRDENRRLWHVHQ